MRRDSSILGKSLSLHGLVAIMQLVTALFAVWRPTVHWHAASERPQPCLSADALLPAWIHWAYDFCQYSNEKWS